MENLEPQMKERDELHTQIKQLKKDASLRRKKLKEYNNQKRDLINEIKSKNSDANKAKSQRDKLNQSIQALKKERDKENEEVKALLDEYKGIKDKSPGGNFKQLQKEKNNLEWKLQTTVLEIKKEDALVKRIDKITKELEGFKELIEISKKLEKKRKSSKKVHDKIIMLSEESQSHHEDFIGAVEKIKGVEKKIDDINDKKKVEMDFLDVINKELDEKIPRFKELDKEIIDSEIETVEVYAEKSEKELKEEAQLIYQKFKKGEKLDLEDIYLLRRFNLV